MTRWDKPPLRLIDGDPDQTERVRAWRAAHPGWTLEHHGGTWSWSDGQDIRAFYSLGEALSWTDRADPDTGSPPSAGALFVRRPGGGPPDILA
jgi:hypothetical protein